MAQLKRDRVKYIRDKAKSQYQKAGACQICHSTEKLDFHHYYSLSPLSSERLKGKQAIRPEHDNAASIVIRSAAFIEEK